MSVRDEVRDLVDALPEDQLPVAHRYLASLLDGGEHPLVRFLREAPEEDEEITEDEERAVAEAREDVRLGRTFSMDEVERRLLS